MKSSTLPTVFVSHGAPTLAIEPGPERGAGLLAPLAATGKRPGVNPAWPGAARSGLLLDFGPRGEAGNGSVRAGRVDGGILWP